MNPKYEKSLDQTLDEVKAAFRKTENSPHKHTVRESGRIYFETCLGSDCRHCFEEDAVLSAERRAELALKHPNTINKNIYVPELLIVVGLVLAVFALVYISVLL